MSSQLGLSRKLRALLGTCVVLTLGAVVRWECSGDRAARPDAADAAAARTALAGASPPERTRLVVATVGAAAAKAVSANETAAAAGGPHPITRQRVYLQRELQLVAALQDALDRRDISALRRLTALYRAHVPGDDNQLAEGYTRIADCLSNPSEGARLAAEQYYRAQRASTLRRYIRRICLER